MSTILVPEEHEIVIRSLPLPKWRFFGRQFRFGYTVTSDAIYLPVKKRGITLVDPFEPLRISKEDVKAIEFRPAREIPGNLFVSLLCCFMFLFDLLLGLKQSVFLVAIVAVTLVVGLLDVVLGLRGRFQLKVFSGSRCYEYTPQPQDVWSPRSKVKALERQREFVDACAAAGIQVTDRYVEQRVTAGPPPAILRSRLNSSNSSCPYCKNSLEPAENAVRCDCCGTLYHFECWKLQSQCGIFGCRGKKAIEANNQIKT